MSSTHLELMDLFVERFGQVVYRWELMAILTKRDSTSTRNALDLHIMRMRKRIAPLDLDIVTAWGRGYALEEKSPWPRWPASPRLSIIADIAGRWLLSFVMGGLVEGLCCGPVEGGDDPLIEFDARLVGGLAPSGKASVGYGNAGHQCGPDGFCCAVGAGRFDGRAKLFDRPDLGFGLVEPTVLLVGRHCGYFGVVLETEAASTAGQWEAAATQA